jgi:hypothetical protein
MDAVPVALGDRLFYPSNRIVKAFTPRLPWGTSRAKFIHSRIEAAVRRAPQAMVKVTGGCPGMKAIAAHFRYITKNGRLEIEVDRDAVERGEDALLDIERQWWVGGAHRRCRPPARGLQRHVAVPRGTDPRTVTFAAREFAKNAPTQASREAAVDA